MKKRKSKIMRMMKNIKFKFIKKIKLEIGVAESNSDAVMMAKCIKPSRVTFAGDPENGDKGLSVEQFFKVIEFIMSGKFPSATNQPVEVDVDGFDGKLKAIVHPMNEEREGIDVDVVEAV